MPAMPLTNLATDCTVDERLTPVDAAFAHFTALTASVTETETVPVEGAVGRVLAREVTTATPLPPAPPGLLR